MSRTRRAAYTGAKAIDRTCRNHGSCPYCANGRRHATRKRIEAAESRKD